MGTTDGCGKFLLWVWPCADQQHPGPAREISEAAPTSEFDNWKGPNIARCALHQTLKLLTQLERTTGQMIVKDSPECTSF